MNAIFIPPDPRTNAPEMPVATRLRTRAGSERTYGRDPGGPGGREQPPREGSGPDGPADDDDAGVVGGLPLPDVRAPVAEERLEDRLGGTPPEADALEDAARPRVAVGAVEAVGAFEEAVGREDEARRARQLELELRIGATRPLPERKAGKGQLADPPL